MRRRAVLNRGRALRVTILMPHVEVIGGVRIFMDSLRENLDDSFETLDFRIGRRPGLAKPFAPLVPLWDTLRLLVHVLFVRPDVVHLNPTLDRLSTLRDGLFLTVLRLLGKREVFVFMHGWEEDRCRRIGVHPVKRRLFAWAFGWPRMTVVLANRFKDQLLAQGFEAERIRVDSAMFDAAIFHGLKRQPMLGVRLVFTARLVREKGVWELLDAYAALRQRHPDMSLQMLGSGPELDGLRRAVLERGLEGVRLPGFVSAAEKAQTLLDGDIFVFPTYHDEGCPASLLEAMAAGLPCITTPMGGIPDVFRHGENGLMIQQVTPQTITEAVENLLHDPQRLAHQWWKGSRREHHLSTGAGHL